MKTKSFGSWIALVSTATMATLGLSAQVALSREQGDICQLLEPVIIKGITLDKGEEVTFQWNEKNGKVYVTSDEVDGSIPANSIDCKQD